MPDETAFPASVIWLTGLPSSGKSTIAGKLNSELIASGRTTEWLDGDEVRKKIPGLGFSREEREHYLRLMAFSAFLLERHGITVVASFVSPYRSSREFAAQLCKHFIEVHISTPIAVCEERDAKGMYRKARAGEIKSFTGVDDPYEPPHNPALSLDTSVLSREDCVAKILAHLKRAGR